MNDHDVDVGSLGEEAAKFLGALAGQVAEGVHEVNEHLGTGAAECRYCPICRVVHAVRGTSPEVRAHLAVAGTALLQAAAGLLSTLAADDQPASPRGGFEHIDLDGDGWTDEGDR